MPIWKRRIEQFNGKICKDSKKIEFENDEELEEFYAQYGYEFDEQSLQVQELSLLEIKKLSSVNWIYELYGEQEKDENSKTSFDKDILNVFQEIQGLTI
jgi:hypothetical protein